jgi:hypothetical protein
MHRIFDKVITEAHLHPAYKALIKSIRQIVPGLNAERERIFLLSYAAGYTQAIEDVNNERLKKH